MREKVQVAIAGDVAEAEDMQAILQASGIDSEIDTGGDEGLSLFVAEQDVAAALDALEALSEPDDLIAEP